MLQRNVVAAVRTMIRYIQPCTFLYKTSYLNQVAQKSPSEGLLGVPLFLLLEGRPFTISLTSSFQLGFSLHPPFPTHSSQTRTAQSC